mmetsp:Transcript_2458/g.7526  ORF Transcript_2458/g.7526 Transcript_2458/m.7526 type:complete len:366 (+) Transcript_2458:372-1469(+)
MSSHAPLSVSPATSHLLFSHAKMASLTSSASTFLVSHASCMTETALYGAFGSPSSNANCINRFGSQYPKIPGSTWSNTTSPDSSSTIAPPLCANSWSSSHANSSQLFKIAVMFANLTVAISNGLKYSFPNVASYSFLILGMSAFDPSTNTGFLFFDPTYPDSTARSVPGLPIPAHINNTFATPGSFTGSASPKPGEYPSFRYNVDVFVTSKFSFGNPVSLQNSSPDATEPMPTATTFASFCTSCNAINSSPRNRAISHESKSARCVMHAKTVLRVFPSSGFGNSERTSSNVSSFFVSTRFSSPLCSSNTRRTVRATSRTFFRGAGTNVLLVDATGEASDARRQREETRLPDDARTAEPRNEETRE